MKSGKIWSKKKMGFASFSNKNKRCFKNQNKKIKERDKHLKNVWLWGTVKYSF